MCTYIFVFNIYVYRLLVDTASLLLLTKWHLMLVLYETCDFATQ